MKNLNLIFILIFGCLMLMHSSLKAQSQERDLDVYPYWTYYNNTSNVLYKTLMDRAFELLNERSHLIDKLNTREDWVTRQVYVREALEDITGSYPAKTPLNPVVTDTIVKDGMMIEKLYFESRPGYYVTAIFCKPEKHSDQLPAILFCSGHTKEGFRSSTYQHMIFNYVKKGFAVLAFDPIGQGERIQYLDNEGNPRMGPTHEHSYPGSQAFLAGLSPANYFIWDGIRAVDFLLTRPEVDPDRIGITGRSGGGTQTAYIAAMDSRIYAAAPECYITTFDKLLKSKGPQDAEQNLWHGIARGIDMPDYLEVRAPKPTLIVSTTRDIFSIQGVRDAYHEAQKAFTALGAPDHIQKVEDDAPHESTVKNREATYAFFRKHLNNPGKSMDEEVHIFDPMELWVTPSGNVYQDLGGEDMYSLTKEIVDNTNVFEAKTSSDLKSKIRELANYNLQEKVFDIVFSGRTQYGDFSIEKYLVEGNAGYYLPVVWMRPHQTNGKVLLWLNDNGKKPAGKKGGPVDPFLEAGYSVVIPDLSGSGELGGGFSGGDARIQDVPLNIWYAGILTDKSITAIHGEEIARLRQFILESEDRPEELILMGRGNAGSLLLQVAFMENWPERMILKQPMVSYHSILDNREYEARYLMTAVPGCIRYFDLPDLIDAVDQNKLLIIDPVDGKGDPYSGKSLEHFFHPKDTQARLNKIMTWLAD